MAAVYVPYCTDKTASEELLASHRTYLFVSLNTAYKPCSVHVSPTLLFANTLGAIKPLWKPVND